MTSSTDLLDAATSEQDRLVELVRMCIAEAGYDPRLIEPYLGPAAGFSFRCVDGSIPHEVCWRARELVGIGAPKCYACTVRDNDTKRDGGCRAEGRFVPECDRDERDVEQVLFSHDDARRAESALAERLRSVGYSVKGGH